MYNLGGEIGSKTWRQGYPDLQYRKAGNIEYMTDSNAYEFDDTRINFNKQYTTIGFNRAYNGDDVFDTAEKLAYNKNNHVSQLNENTNRVMEAISFIEQNYEAPTEKKLSNIHGLFLQNYEGYSNSYPETEYLKFINLGLVEREKVDLSLDADVYSVKTTINGEEMNYKYYQNTADSTKYHNGENDYYLGEKLRKAYDLDFYTSDYYYRTDGQDAYYDSNNDINDNTRGNDIKNYKQTDITIPNVDSNNPVNKNSSELDAQVTYRVRIANNNIKQDEPHITAPGISSDKDIPVETQIDELAIYYDKNFILADNDKEVAIKKKNETTGILEDSSHKVSSVRCGTKDALNNGDESQIKTLKINKTSKYKNANETIDNKYSETQYNYNVMYLTGMDGIWLDENEDIYVEITLTIDKENRDGIERCLKITEDEDMGLELIAEISAYTTKYDDNYYHKAFAGKMAGLVDRDSNPGNLGVNNNNGAVEPNPVTNCEDYQKYEDDTYKVGIKIGLLNEPSNSLNPPDKEPKDERKITGMVWDDARSEKIQDGNDTNIQYVGNGEFNYISNSSTNDRNFNKIEGTAKTNPSISYDRDMPIKNVKVSLIEVVQTKAKDDNGEAIYYEYPARYTYTLKDKNNKIICEKGKKIETKTDQNGNYTLGYFIPGYYKVRFDYGYDEEDKESVLYNGQDYKSTAYYNEYKGGKLYYSQAEGNDSLYKTDNIGGNGNFNYFDAVKETLEEENYSDAQDDEIRRLNVNAYSETMTALQATIFSETSLTSKDERQTMEHSDNDQYKDYEDYVKANEKILIKNTQMHAETAIFYVKPEEIKAGSTLIEPMGDEYKNEDFNKARLWNINHLDFGIEYRPEVTVLLDKEIASIQLITSDNKELVQLYFKEENGERVIDKGKSTGYQNVQFVPNEDKTKQGFVYINMDTEILEGCTLKVDYEMTTTNDSEVDRINENLDDIKYEVGANEYGVDYKVFTRQGVGTSDDSKEQDIKYTYNANATAAQLLCDRYYGKQSTEPYYNAEEAKERYSYLKRLKKPYISQGKTEIKNNLRLEGQEYYGIYEGETYYTGKKGSKDIVAELKVDHILDYVDNDFAFSESENNTKDRLWSTTTSKELYDNNAINWRKANYTEVEEKEGALRIKRKYLLDKYGIRYDTNHRSNLALSVDDNRAGNLAGGRNEGNVSLSRFLIPKKTEPTESNGKINMIASKILSAEDVKRGNGLSYENMAEVIQYTTLTGRRTTLPKDGKGGVIGNGNTKFWNGYEPDDNPNDPKGPEDDTDATEIITISPPTGLTE